jgi:hypothetical protein
MLLAKIICSDPECYEEIELPIDRLEELDGLTCECGYGFVLASVAELKEPGGELVSIRVRRTARPDTRRAA